MKPKVLVLSNLILHYRVPILNILSSYCDLTVAYNYGKEPEESERKFKLLKLNPFKIWKFTFQKENLQKLCKKYDVVISLGEFAYLKYTFLSLLKNRNFKLLYWGIGAPASYTRPYGQASKTYLALTNFSGKKADGYIAYSEEGKKFLINQGFDTNKVFIANNTVEVTKITLNRDKKNILFIGSLYRQKGIDKLLEAYKKTYEKHPNLPILEIIGDGELKQEIENWIKTNNLSNKVILHGAIYASEKKQAIFNNALACISPNQAGLAVLESMGYGVPYITYENAITGGEIFNIKNEYNGLLLNRNESLDKIIEDIHLNPSKFLKMGENAYSYYWGNRKPEDMAKGFKDAIEYVLKN